MRPDTVPVSQRRHAMKQIDERRSPKEPPMLIVFTGVFLVMVLGCLFFAGAIGSIPNSAGPRIAYAQSEGDNVASGRAFQEASKVFLHPRCVNCHPAGDAPLQGEEHRPHAMRVKRGPEGLGKAAMECSSCHQSKNQAGAHTPPGAPGWKLPPENMPMVFEGKTPKELCVQLKDPSKNGNLNVKAVLEHVRTAPLVLWGWNPGEGRVPVPMSHEEFVRLMTVWADKGAACPD
jgi:hypothetical protein